MHIITITLANTEPITTPVGKVESCPADWKSISFIVWSKYSLYVFQFLIATICVVHLNKWWRAHEEHKIPETEWNLEQQYQQQNKRKINIIFSNFVRVAYIDG